MKGLILAGGFATRLRPLSCSKPKLLFPIVGVPLIDVMLDWMKPAGVTEVILAVNHLADRMRKEIGEKRRGLDVLYSIEPEPLGTGGALRLASTLADSQQLLVLNGDTYCRFDSQRLLGVQSRNRGAATLWLISVQGGGSTLRTSRGGRLVQGHRGPNESLQSLLVQLVAFVEVDGAPDVAFETGIEEA